MKVPPDNPYSKMQKDHYEGIAPHWGEYRNHNDNPDYWYSLMSPLRQGSWNGKRALDFGSGQGRNILNILNMCNIDGADGCDISPSNNKITAEKLKQYSGRFVLYNVNGVELNGVPSDTYDFAMSVVVFQHICVHSIRMNIMKDIHRVMRNGGIFSFQMGFGVNLTRPTCGYHEDRLDATDTNGGLDVSVMDPMDLVRDLEKIGFNRISFEIKSPWDCAHASWIYVKAMK